MGGTQREPFGRAERAQALVRGSAVIAGAAAVDLAFGAPAGGRLGVWAAWVAVYFAAGHATRLAPERSARFIGLFTSLVAVAALVLLAALGDGARSPLFLLMPMVPLLAALVSYGDTVMPALQGFFTVVGGAWVLRHEGRGWGDVAVWATCAAVATAFALGAARAARQRQEAHVRLLAERAAAQAMLAEAERRRGEAERWVAAGHLADQVAHDVNSPLASLRANLAFAREELIAAGADPEVLQALRDGEEAIEEIRGAVSSLKVRTLPPPGRKETASG